MTTLAATRTRRIRDAATITRGYAAHAYWRAIGQHLPGAITISVRVWHSVRLEEHLTRRQANSRLAWAAENYAGWDDLGSNHTSRTLILHLDDAEHVNTYCEAFEIIRHDPYDDEEA